MCTTLCKAQQQGSDKDLHKRGPKQLHKVCCKPMTPAGWSRSGSISIKFAELSLDP